jgi:hypothetical protein
MNVPVALRIYAEVLNVRVRRLAIRFETISKNNVNMSLPAALKGMLIITLVTVQKTTQEHTHHISTEKW